MIESAAPVTFDDGVVVSRAALQLHWQLEARGLNLEREGDQLAVFPPELLTDADRRQIRAHR